MLDIKKNIKKVLATVMIASVSVVAVVAETPAYAAEQTNPFTDVKQGYTHYNSIVTLYNDGIVTGINATQFKPNDSATRADAALFLANALQLDTTNVTNPGFTDVPTTSKYYGAIAALYANGIIGGYGKEFKPNNTLTRSQIAKMLTLGFQLNLATSTTSKFTDVNKLKDADTKRYIQTLVDYSITSGQTPTTFGPNNQLTRGQLATFIFNAIEATDEALEVISVE